MTEKKHIRVSTPPSQGAMEPIRLETARWYKKLREEHPAVLGRVHQFTAGDILVHQGETVDGPVAFLVVEGMLSEKQTHFTSDQGHVSMTMFHVSPGSIAFVQAISPQFASQPSFTTIVAETDGEALLLDPDAIRRELGKHGFLLSAQLRLQQQLLVSIWHQKLAYAVDNKLMDLIREMQSKQPHLRTSDDIVQEIGVWVAERSDVSVRMANMKAAYQLEQNDIRQLKQIVEGLETALKLAQMEASELRRISPIAALEEERRLMALRSLGTELYLDRLRKEWARAGLDTHPLDFTADESKLLTAEEPEGLAEIVQRIRSTNQWDDDEIDAAIQLGVSPNRSTPPERDDVDELLANYVQAEEPAIPQVKTRPHISTIGFEDVDLASIRAEAAKPLVPHGADIVSLDLEGGLPRVETPYRAPMRTLDYSEERLDGSLEEDPEIMILSDDDLLTLDED